MNFRILLTIFALSCFSISCSSDEPADYNYGNCIDTDAVSIIPEGTEIRACMYQELYLYNAQYYTILQCCVCDLVYMAYDCDGDPLCDFTDDCMLDFSENAQYQFTFLEK